MIVPALLKHSWEYHVPESLFVQMDVIMCVIGSVLS